MRHLGVPCYEIFEEFLLCGDAIRKGFIIFHSILFVSLFSLLYINFSFTLKLLTCKLIIEDKVDLASSDNLFKKYKKLFNKLLDRCFDKVCLSFLQYKIHQLKVRI